MVPFEAFLDVLQPGANDAGKDETENEEKEFAFPPWRGGRFLWVFRRASVF